MASLSLSPQKAPPPWITASTTTSPDKTYSQRDDCALGRCTFNCPQWCILPPPPPLFLNSGQDDGGSSSSSSRISPLMAALIAVLAAAFLLLFYFTVISKFCRRRSGSRNRNRNSSFLDTSVPLSARVDSLIRDPARPGTGLDDSFIRQITVFQYNKEDKLIDATECSVCLNEFQEGEKLRLMPNCEHAFHIPCIDTWLKTQSNCPICRATMNPIPVRSGSGSGSGNGSHVGLAALRVDRRRNDVVLVIREGENRVQIVEEIAQDERGGRENSEERETKLEAKNNKNNHHNSNNDDYNIR